VGTPFLCFSNAPLPASNNFWTKVQLTRISYAFVSTNILLSLIIFFSLLYNIFNISLPPYSRVSYKNLNGWEFGHWLTANFTSPAVTWKDIVWSFSLFVWCNKNLPGRSASITIAFEFLYVCLYVHPKRFFGGSENCACFRNSIPFFDLQIVFYAQMTSIINSIFF